MGLRPRGGVVAEEVEGRGSDSDLKSSECEKASSLNAPAHFVLRVNARVFKQKPKKKKVDGVKVSVTVTFSQNVPGRLLYFGSPLCDITIQLSFFFLGLFLVYFLALASGANCVRA